MTNVFEQCKTSIEEQIAGLERKEKSICEHITELTFDLNHEQFRLKEVMEKIHDLKELRDHLENADLTS